MQRLSDKNPDDLEYKRNLAVYDTERARAQIEIGRFADAVPVLERVIAMMIPIAEKEGGPTYRYDVAMAHRLVAKAYFNTGQRQRAAEHIDKAIAIARELREANTLRDADKNILTELENEKLSYIGANK